MSVILILISSRDALNDVDCDALQRIRLRLVFYALEVANRIALAAEHSRDSSDRSDMRVVDLHMAGQALVYSLLVLE